MSDQPPWDQNIERQIPGLRKAVSDLASVTSNSGFRIVTIVLGQDQQRPGSNVPPTRIAFASDTEAVPETLAVTTEAIERWAPAHPSGTQWRVSDDVPMPTQAAQETGTEERAAPHRPKRASTSLLEGEGEGGAQFGKRKRLSEPPSGAQRSPSGAFWGTVLEERPGTPQGMMPSQPRGSLYAPTLRGPPQPAAEIHRELHSGQEALRRTQTGVASEQREEERVQRQTTFPALRLRSPIGHGPRRPILPSLREPLFETSSHPFRDRFARSPAPTHPGRQPPERRFFRRTASHLFGRLSPFGAPGPSTSRGPASPPPVHTESQFYTGRGLGLPAMQGAFPRPATEVLSSQPAPGDILHRQLFPSVQQVPHEGVIGQYGANITQSGSRSASGSGVSHAPPSGAPASPSGEASEIQPVVVAARGRRGRRIGSAQEREQSFACETCGTPFKRKSDKNRHVRVVHEKSRPFMCPLCPKTFGEKSNMLKHRASVHDDVRTFRCPYCDSRFSQRGLCDTHVKNVHDKKQAKYFCEHCGLPFSRKVQLNDHYEQAHPAFMASYGRYYAGSSSTAPGATATPAAAQLPSRDDRTLVGDTIQPVQHLEPAAGAPPAFAGPVPAEGTTTPPPSGLQYPLPQLPPPPHQDHEEGNGRRRSFQGDSSR